MRNGLGGSRELKASHEGGNGNNFFREFHLFILFLPSADTGPDPQRGKKEKGKKNKTEPN